MEPSPVRGIARHGFLAIVDQSVVSATTFLTALILARTMEPADYGAFVVAFATLLLLNEAQSVIIFSPLMVLGASKDGEDAKKYFSSMAVLHTGIGILMAVTLGATAEIFPVSPTASQTLSGLAWGLVLLQAHEFIRRSWFARQRPARALMVDTIKGIVQLGFIMAMIAADRDAASPRWLNGRNVFLAMGLACILPCALQGRRIWEGVRSRLSDLRTAFRESWSYGRWELGTVLGGMMLGLLNTYLVAGFGGAHGAAEFEASRLLLAPIQVLTLAGGYWLVPLASRRFVSEGARRSAGVLLQVAIPWFLIIAAYSTVVYAAPERWLSWFYGERYSHAGPTVTLWVLIYALIGLRAIPAAYLAGARRPEWIMGPSLVAGAVTLGLTAWLSPGEPVQGAMMARVAGESILLALLGAMGVRLFLKSSETTAR